MPKFDIKKIINVGAHLAVPVIAPGAAGGILSIIDNIIDDENDPQNLGGLRELAKHDEDTVVVLTDHEKRLRALEKAAGL